MQLILLGFAALAAADVKHLTDRNLDLFKYNPSDIYTLPEDIDDDKPAVQFSGDVMKAKTEKLQNYNSGKKFKLEWVCFPKGQLKIRIINEESKDISFSMQGSFLKFLKNVKLK